MRAKEFITERKKKRRKTKRAYGGYFYPGFGYGVSGDSSGGDGGGGGESLREGREVDLAGEVEKAASWAGELLEIENMPKIELSMDHDEAQGNHHTGGHVPGSGHIWVYARNRNLVDILRTVFHELVHVRQHELGLIGPDDSYPGSPIEMEGDVIAGKYIKVYGKENPQIFEGMA